MKVGLSAEKEPTELWDSGSRGFGRRDYGASEFAQGGVCVRLGAPIPSLETGAS